MRRELLALYATPLGWAALGGGQLILGWLFFVQLEVYQKLQPQLTAGGSLLGTNDLVISPTLNTAGLLIMLIGPLFGMQGFAAERRSGRMTALLAAPVSPAALVAGKFLGQWLGLLPIALLAVALVGTLGLAAPLDLGRLASAALVLAALSALVAALSLCISSLGSHPGAATAVTYGLLLLLWLLDAGGKDAPWHWFALSPHLEPALRGLVRLEDLGYFASVSLAALALTTLHVWLAGGPAIALRPLRLGLFHALLLACLGLLGTALGRTAWDVDWSQHGRNRLAPAVAQQAAALQGPLRITAYAPDRVLFRAQTENLVERLRRAGAIVELTFVDPVREPERAREAGVRRPGELLLAHQGREERLARPDQRSLGQALGRLARSGSPWIVTLEGHGERDLLGAASTDLGQFGALLEARGFSLLPLSLTASAAVPENAALLIVAAPVEPPGAAERQRVTEWIGRGGALLWLAERPLPPAVAASLGLERLAGQVVDAAAADVGLDDPTVAVATDHRAHPGLEGIERPLLFPGALGWRLAPLEGWSTAVLASSSPRSWNETGPVRGRVRRDGELGEQAGPLPLGVAFERDTVDGRQRIAVIGDADWLSNGWLGRGDNRAFALNLVRWLTEQTVPGDTAPDTPPDQRVDWSPLTGGLAAATWLLVVPAALVLTGLRVRVRRRRG